MRKLIILFLLSFSFSDFSNAEMMKISSNCNLKVWENGKWTSVSASEFTDMKLNVKSNPKFPEYSVFRIDGKFYTAKKSCFSEARVESRFSRKSYDSKRAKTWTVWGGIGYSISPKDKHEISFQNATTVTDFTRKNLFSFGIEGRKHLTDNLFSSIAVDALSYPLDSDGRGFDVMNLAIIPGIAFGDVFRVWTGMGAGISLLSTSSGSSAAYQEKMLVALDLSPRVGFNFDVGDKYMLDIMASYNMIGPVDWGGTVSVGGTSLDFVDTIRISYFSIMLRMGQEF